MTTPGVSQDSDMIAGSLAASLAQFPEVLAVGWLHRSSGRSLWKHRDAGDPAAEAAAREFASRPPDSNAAQSPERIRLPAGRALLLQAVPFTLDEIMATIVPSAALDVATHALAAARINLLRDRVGSLMKKGLPGRIDDFPATDNDFLKVIGALRGLPADDLVGRLGLAGFADHPVATGDAVPMRCKECIYFLPHRRWCDLPELPLPVEADWYCRLWKM